jgi:spore photoproduct lyase
MKVIHKSTKTFKTRDNGRSADCISPNFIYGCLGGCMKSYCYVGRYNPDTVQVYTERELIFKSVNKWVKDKPWPKIPNQTDPTYYTVDIGCSTDVPLMSKHYEWQQVFDFFNSSEKLKSTFATKYPTRFPTYNLDPTKNRIRVSLMPQVYSDVLEPNTDKIIDRIDSIPKLQEQLEVHINFSPIIYTEGWLKEYHKLFELLHTRGIDLKCECIFLTYNIIQEMRNSPAVNSLCRRPEFQEFKDSEYAPDNIRYKSYLKSSMVKVFTQLYSQFFDPKNIRYIF